MKMLPLVRALAVCWWAGVRGVSAGCALDVALTPEMLQRLLGRYPDADANKDSVLSEHEARASYAKQRAAKAH